MSKKKPKRKIKTWLAITIGIFCGIVLALSYNLVKKMINNLNYQKQIEKLDDKLKEDYENYQNDPNNNLKYDKSAIDKFTDCIKNPLDQKEYSTKLTNNINKLNNV